MNNTLNAPTALQERATVAASATRPFLARAADANFLRGPGEQIAFQATVARTGGAVAVASAIVEVNAGPPPHVHADADEIFLIQSGAFELLINGELVTARAGDVAYLARGEAHRFRGLDSGQPNRFHLLAAPGEFEYFMRRWVPLFENGAPDMEEAAALCGEYNIALFPGDEAAPVAANPQTKIISADNAPQPLSVLGSQVTPLLGSAETQGRCALIRVEAPRDFGIPPHFHQSEDELMIVEAGRIEFRLGEETVIAEPGDMAWAPRGHVHGFRIASEAARMSVWMTPGGFEQFFVESALMELAGEANPATIAALSERFGLRFVDA